MAAPAPAPLANRDGTIGDPDRTALQLWARSQGLPPADIERIVAAYDRSKAPRSPDWQLEIQQTAQELQRQGMDPRTVDAVVRLMGQTRDPKNAPLAELPNRAAEGAAREIMGPSPGRSKQLAGRDPGFMQDQRAETLDYRQPDLDRPRPKKPTAPAASPSAARPQASPPTRAPDGGFVGPVAPAIPTRHPLQIMPDLSPTLRPVPHPTRPALYDQISEAIQGRILPAPDNMASAMSDAYLLEQAIPALRERFADRPDILARLDTIERTATYDPIMSALGGPPQVGGGERPMELGTDPGRPGPLDPVSRMNADPRFPSPGPVDNAPPPRPVSTPLVPPRERQMEARRDAVWEERMSAPEPVAARAQQQRGPAPASPRLGADTGPTLAPEPPAPQVATAVIGEDVPGYKRPQWRIPTEPAAPARSAAPPAKGGGGGSAAMARDLVGPPRGKPSPADSAAGGLMGGLVVADEIDRRYGTNPSRITDEYLRELLLIARGQYPAGGMTATR